MGRTERFQRNPALEQLLSELNKHLAPADTAASAGWDRPKYPVLLVIGPPRSGTTLLLQWLAELGHFAYPTNLLARFYAAPYLGALINRLIGDPQFNYGDELFDHSLGARQYRSDLGKTQGMLQPSEFWYFWRRFIPNDQAEPLDAAALQSVDGQGFLRGIAALQAAYDKPWAMKGIILQYNLAYLDRLFERVIFLYTRRDSADNARSLLQARQRYFGDPSKWFSVRPPNSEQLLSLSPAQQVVGQVELTRRSIEHEFSAIAPNRRLTIDYASFCADPAQTYRALAAALESQDSAIPDPYPGPASFVAQDRPVAAGENDAIDRAIATIDEWLPGPNGAAGSA